MKTSARAVVIVALVVACHDGRNLDFTAPSVALTFPPLVSSTDAASITVTGTAEDPSGVSEVRVNGVLATTTDEFASWHASVPLAAGMNTLTVAAIDLHGNSDSAAAEARIESQALLLEPSGIAVDPFAQIAYVVSQGAIRAVDLASGTRTTVSGDSRGTGPALRASRIALDLVGQQLLVASHGTPTSLIAVDIASGNRAILSDATHGMGPPTGGVQAIVVDGDRALVIGTGMIPAQVMAIDLSSGDRTILSNASVGSGPAFQGPDSIVMDGNRALVVDHNRVMAVDLSSGDRTILSDENSYGPDFLSPRGITVDYGRALVVCAGFEPTGVIAVDLEGGSRRLHSGGSTGGGPGFAYGPTAIALDGHQALVTDPYLDALLGIDLVSGERSFVSAPTTVGTGPSFSTVAIAVDGERALMGGAGMSSLLALDLATGDRTIVSSAFTGNGPHFSGVQALAVDGGRALVMARLLGSTPPDEDTTDDALFAVDLASGDRSLLSHWSRGTGPTFDDPEDIAVFGNQALVIMDDRSLIVVDLASGDRRSFGNLPSLNSPSGIVVDGDRAVLLAEYNDSSSVIVAIDLASEESSILSAFETRGEGPNLREDAQDLALDGDRVLVIDGASIIAVDLATGDRTLLTDYSTGTGPVTGYRRVERTRDGLVLTDWYLGAVLALELQFGQRTILAR